MKLTRYTMPSGRVGYSDPGNAIIPDGPEPVIDEIEVTPDQRDLLMHNPGVYKFEKDEKSKKGKVVPKR